MAITLKFTDSIIDKSILLVGKRCTGKTLMIKDFYINQLKEIKKG